MTDDHYDNFVVMEFSKVIKQEQQLRLFGR